MSGKRSTFNHPRGRSPKRWCGRSRPQGIDGIGITDHHNKDWSFEFRELVEEHFPGEVVIIPGWEIEVRPEQNPFAEYQVAELFLPRYG